MMGAWISSGLRALIGGRPLTDLAACRAELDHIRVIRSALDTRELQIVARLDEIAAAQPSVFPEDEVAKASKTTLNKSTKVRQRKKACDDVPQLADALANGDTTGDRVDTFAKATNGLTPDEMAKVSEHGDAIAAAAANATERQYRETIERIIGRARHDDGLDQLARQRANVPVPVLDRGRWDVELRRPLRPRPRHRTRRPHPQRHRHPVPRHRPPTTHPLIRSNDKNTSPRSPCSRCPRARAPPAYPT